MILLLLKVSAFGWKIICSPYLYNTCKYKELVKISHLLTYLIQESGKKKHEDWKSKTPSQWESQSDFRGYGRNQVA